MSKAEHKRLILQELSRYPAIRENKRKLVVAHAFGELDLRKTGQLLTSDEKAKFGLNQGRPVSTVMIDLVEPGFLSCFDIDEALSLITINARNKYRLWSHWNDLVNAPEVSKIEYRTTVDDLTCRWCKERDRKLLRKDFRLPRHIDRNCGCLWFRGSVIAA